jgi:hypothetical protein
MVWFLFAGLVTSPFSGTVWSSPCLGCGLSLRAGLMTSSPGGYGRVDVMVEIKIGKLCV